MTPHQIRTYLAVGQWQRTHNPHKPHRMIDLMRVLSADAMSLALALNMTGWTRDPVRLTSNNRRQLQTYWIPPDGKPVSRRRRGRPSFADLFSPT
jgi:hypothetical protein